VRAVFPFLSYCCFFFCSADVLTPHLSVEGIDINSMTPPSEIRMFQFVTNMRLMRVVKRVIDELKAAGFKMNSDVRSLRLVGGYGEKNIDLMFHFSFPFFLFSRTRCRRLWV
jgi:hypothetical protein